MGVDIFLQDDEELWTALQPALQLVTRVLQMNHPFWRACLDYLCAIEIPEHRKSENHQDKKLIYIDPDEPKDFFRKLGASTRARLALEYLQERIWFSIKSSHHFNVVCTGKRNPDDTTGETVPFHRHNPVNFRLEVVIAAEIMWPLLVPEYNIVEKQNCSLVIGTTILHELAVCLSSPHFLSRCIMLTQASIVNSMPPTLPCMPRAQTLQIQKSVIEPGTIPSGSMKEKLRSDMPLRIK